VNAPKHVSRLLGAAVEQQTGLNMSYETVVYHSLKSPVVNCRDTAVHRLTQLDSHLLTAAPPQLQVGAFGDMNTLISRRSSSLCNCRRGRRDNRLPLGYYRAACRHQRYDPRTLARTSLRNLRGITGRRASAACRARAGLDHDRRRLCVNPHRRKTRFCGDISPDYNIRCPAGPLATQGHSTVSLPPDLAPCVASNPVVCLDRSPREG